MPNDTPGNDISEVQMPDVFVHIQEDMADARGRPSATSAMSLRPMLTVENRIDYRNERRGWE